MTQKNLWFPPSNFYLLAVTMFYSSLSPDVTEGEYLY